MLLRELIEGLGYSPREAAVYLASLELGGSTETEIAEKAKLARTTVASVIDALHKKGLINAYLKGRRKIWAAENPEKILAMLKEREASLSTMLPELHSLRHGTEKRPMVSTYTGTEEIKQIMADILATKHHILAALAWDAWIRALGKPFVEGFIEERKRRYLRIRLLTQRTEASVALKERDGVDMRITQFLPENAGLSNANFLYGNKVAIISVDTKRPTGILIEDEDIHRTMQTFFESAWLRSGGMLDQLS